MKLKRYISLLGLVLFVYILFRIDISNLYRELTRINLPLFFLALALLVPVLCTQTIKWFILARKQQIPIPFGAAFLINLKSNFYGFITPSRAGTVIRAEYMKGYARGRAKGISNFVIDKLLDLWAVVCISFVFVFFLKSDVVFSLAKIYFPLLILVLFCLTLFAINRRQARMIFGKLYQTVLPSSLRKKASTFIASFYSHAPSPSVLVLFFFVSVFHWILIYYLNFVVALSFGIAIDFASFLAIVPFGTLIALIPISVNGLGTKEAALIFLFSLFAVSAAKVVSMSLVTLCIIGLIPAIIGGILIFFEKD